MATTLIATLTNLGAQRHSQLLETAKSFKITHFEIGTLGHDPLDPLSATAPDASITETPGRVFGPEAVDGMGILSPTCRYWDCTVESGEANDTLISSIVLIATIMNNGSDTVDEEGDTFPYAIAHFARTPKGVGDVLEFQVGVQA